MVVRGRPELTMFRAYHTDWFVYRSINGFRVIVPIAVNLSSFANKGVCVFTSPFSGPPQNTAFRTTTSWSSNVIPSYLVKVAVNRTFDLNFGIYISIADAGIAVFVSVSFSSPLNEVFQVKAT